MKRTESNHRCAKCHIGIAHNIQARAEELVRQIEVGEIDLVSKSS